MSCDDNNNKLHYAALAWDAGLGPAGMRRLISYFGSTQDVINAGRDALQNPTLRLDERQIHLISTIHQRLDETEAKLRQLRDEHITVLCDWEPEFPELLRQIGNPPTVLCVAGRVLPADDPAINIVGTRQATEQGLRLAGVMAEAFADNGVTVVSGLAKGCDAAAHTGALDANGRTIAVMGSGIRVIRPRQNAPIARRIFENGAIISEQPPDARPNVAGLMARNRLQSALAMGVLVIESRQTGGAMATAEHAVRQQRKLYAIKWAGIKENSQGTEKLLRQEAIPVRGTSAVPHIKQQLIEHREQIRTVFRRQQAQQSLFDDDAGSRSDR